jgi:preprotein translocase subunit SecE
MSAPSSKEARASRGEEHRGNMSTTKEKELVEQQHESSLGDFFRPDVYKPRQGMIARQATGFAIAVGFVLGSWSLYQQLAINMAPTWAGGIAILVMLAGWWFSFRIVNLPVFADFLISVQAEMNKVTWPGETEVYRSTAVVIFVMFALALLLYMFDTLWMAIFWFLGVTP